MKKTILPLLIMLQLCAFAQVENKDIEEGNEFYKQQDYSGAQQSYQNALSKNAESEAGIYNLGNTYYQQKNYEEAIRNYQKIAETTTDPNVRAQAYHNMGNALLEQKKYQESIAAYKQSLRNNPDDAETKYNLAYAQKMMQQQQQQQNQDQKKEDEKKEDEKKQDEQKNEEQNKDQQEQQKQEQQSQPKQFSNDELERIMQALNADDKEVQDKINQQKMKTMEVAVEKDW